MKNIFKKINSSKHRNLICVLGLVLVFIVLPNDVLAAWYDNAVVNSVFYLITWFLGSVVTFLIGFLMRVVAYNDFTTVSAVQTGWKLMRDVCNMFFIVILMVIAVSTIIRVESYNYKKMLPKLLVKAVLINFSLMFCGLLIDASQVITLTFVDAFKTAGAGNFITGLGLTKVLQYSKVGSPGTGTAITLLLGMFMLAIATVVIGALVIVFLGRIVAFWVLIVLSPFTFLASASGEGGHGGFSSYANKWWDEFTKYLIVGPVLAFFLWLSLFMMREFYLQEITANMEMNAVSSIGSSEAGEPNNLAFFSISIAMLLGSLVAAQQIGTIGSGMAGKVAGGAKKGAWSVAKFAGRRIDDAEWGGRGLTKYGGKFVHGTLNKIGLGDSRLAQSAKGLYEHGGVQIRTIPGSVKDSFEGLEKRSILKGRGAMGEAMDRLIMNEETYKYENVLAQERSEEMKKLKEIGADGDSSKLLHILDEEAAKGEGKNQAVYDAAVEALFQAKDEDAFLAHFAKNASKKQLDEMGWKKVIGKDGKEKAVGNYTGQAMSAALRGSDIRKTFATHLGSIAISLGNPKSYDLAGFDPETGKQEWKYLSKDSAGDIKFDEEKHAELIASKAESVGRNYIHQLTGRNIGTQEFMVDVESGDTKTKFVDYDASTKKLQSILGPLIERIQRMRFDAIMAPLKIDKNKLSSLTPSEANKKIDEIKKTGRFSPAYISGMPSALLSQINTARQQVGLHNFQLEKDKDKNEIIIDPTSGGSTSGSIMADVNKKKYDATEEKIKEFEDNELDFYVSDDYKKNKEQYYARGEMERIDRSKSRVVKAKEEGELIDSKTGMKRVDVMSGINTAKTQGKKGGPASLAINSEKLKGLITEGAAGVNISDEKSKKEAIEKLGAFYMDQLKAQNDQLEDAQKLSDEQLQAEVDSLKSSLSQASSISLVNKNREGFDARSVLRHELMHDRVANADQGKLKKIWDSIDEDKKDEINKRIRSEWDGGADFTDDQVMNEYFAEGAANFGRKDTEGGIQLTDVRQVKALQQAGVKMKGMPERYEDIQVGKVSKSELNEEVRQAKKEEERKAKEANRQEKEDSEIDKKRELGDAKADAQDKVGDYRQKTTEREELEKKLEDNKKVLGEDKKSAQFLKQQAVQAKKEGRTKASNDLLKQYNTKVKSIRNNEKIVDKISEDVEKAKAEENEARQKAQESTSNFTAKRNIFKADDLQKKRDSVEGVYKIKVPKAKAPKIDFDKQISDLQIDKQRAMEKAVMTGNKSGVDSIDKKISELQAQKTNQPKESSKDEFEEIDINKDIRGLQGVIKNLKDELKSGGKSDEEKEVIKKNIGANEVKLGILKDQKSRAIDQEIQKFGQQKTGTPVDQKNMGQGEVATNQAEIPPTSKPFSVKDFVDVTSVSEKIPSDYQVDAKNQQVVNNNITNIINAAAGGGGAKELQNAMTSSLSSPAGRFWLAKAMKKGLSDVPDDIKKKLSPDFVNLVDDAEKAAQDKKFAGKMKNYMEDVRVALEGLGKRE